MKKAPPWPAIRVQWRKLPATDVELTEAARQIAATVLGHMQRSGSVPSVLGPGLTAPGEAKTTVQAAEPLTYIEADQKITAVQFADFDDGVVTFLTESGEVISVKTGARGRGPGRFGAVDDPTRALRPVQQRRPMRINRRPGKGGLQRSSAIDAIDPTEGLDEFGETLWWGVKGGASIGLLEIAPEGTAVILCRLSSEEKNDRLIDQLRPCLALAKQHGLKVRMVIFAVKMSGTREVRPERASAPIDDTLEREDIFELDKFIEAGWVEHIIARGGDRIARDILPGETLLTRWAKKKISLWLSDFGRRMNYANDSGDRMLVRTMMMISAEERNTIVRRLQTAALNKGPLAGKGHLGPPRFGFLRNKKTRDLYEDPEQWPWILRAFALADSGECLDGDALSVRKLARTLKDEGCPFSHQRLLAILKDPIYATGEFTTNVRGVPIRQNPIQLENAVPLDRFQRVQNLLALRQGSNKNTPLGEFLLNYVATHHKQCRDTEIKGRHPLVKGYIISNHKSRDARLYRHGYGTPECCRTGGRGYRGFFTWERGWIEKPIIEAIRELAIHPEIRRQLEVAARHTINEGTARLSDEQRAALERELLELDQRREQAIDEWIDSTAAGTPLTGYSELMDGFDKRANALKKRIEVDDAARTRDAAERPVRDEHVDAFLEILTVDTPTDPFLRQLRARLFQQIVSSVEIDDDGEGPITVTLEGHLVPEGAPLSAGNPILAAEDLLDSYIARNNGKTDAAKQMLEEVRQVQTGLSESADKAVSISAFTAGNALSLPSNESLRMAIRRSLDSESWAWRVAEARKSGEPSWVKVLVIEVDA